ncbi:MAG TPA: phosphoribosylglycinamide formyltransferase [Thermoplasmata archaeon]|nr:phosphoribosylglycinamide formyltransferase [Thermoplasmata archaeon]
MPRRLALGVLASGEGTTLEALAEQAAGGHVPARIALVLSDRPTASVLEKARRRGLATAVLPVKGTPEETWTARATQILTEAGVELVVLAGFLSILPLSFTKAWEGRAVNVHPSLLPRYGGKGLYGDRVHAAVLAAGDAETGATIHLVTQEVDGGPVLAQQRVLVEPGDTPESLRRRVQAAERVALYSVIAHFAEGEWPLPYRRPVDRTRS